jgi:hypothetical protein
MKIIQNFKTLLPCIPSSAILTIPCQIDYLDVDYDKRCFIVNLAKDEKFTLYFTSEPHLYKSFQLTNVSVFSEIELREMAQQFGFNLLAYPNSPGIYSAVLSFSEEPESILYIVFQKHIGRDFCFIQQLNGHRDTDGALPLIWRVAEVEFSEEFSQKLEKHWQEKLKVFSTGYPEGYTPRQK